MTHTAAPWVLHNRQEMEDGGIYPMHITGGEREVQICSLETTVIAKMRYEDMGTYTNSDAEFIVRACNAHDAYESLLRDVSATLHPHDPLRTRILDELSKHGAA